MTPQEKRDSLLRQRAALRQRIEEMEAEWGDLTREIRELDEEIGEG